MKKKILFGVLCILLAVGVYYISNQRNQAAHLEDHPNIVLITIDTLRADHLGVYGHERNTSPTLDSMASEGLLFRYALSQAPWTLPSITSIHTSLYPSEHNVKTVEEKLSKRATTTAEVLRAMGYRTIGVVSHRFVGKEYGLDQGFDIFDESQIATHLSITSENITKIALKHINSSPEGPFFLWVHYFDPHFTYQRHGEFEFASYNPGNIPDKIRPGYLTRSVAEGRRWSAEDISFIKAVYDEEIAYTDRWIGKLMEGIESRELGDATISILTADHGEYFMERGEFFHGKDVYDELVHVPLIISGAIDDSLRGRIVDFPAETSSIPKTIMAMLNNRKHPFRGVDLLLLASGDSKSEFIFTEGLYAWGKWGRKKAIVSTAWKLIYNFDTRKYELYDRTSDPSETVNVWHDYDPAAAPDINRMKRELDRFPLRKKAIAAEIELSEEAVRQIESLGYVR